MTEEIIIDGANVAGCGAYKDKHCIDKTSIIFCDTNLCSNYPYCYYKQLKRLEQENKELKAYKDVNEDFKKAWDELNEKYKQLRSALEEINKIVEPRFVNGLNEEADLYNLTADRVQEKIREVLK